MSEIPMRHGNRYGTTNLHDQATALLGDLNLGNLVQIQQATFISCSQASHQSKPLAPKVVRQNCVFPAYTIETITTFQDGEEVAARGTACTTELIWERREDLGAGVFGEVHREDCTEAENTLKSRAVKVLRRRQLDRMNIDYKKELEPLIHLSQVNRFLAVSSISLAKPLLQPNYAQRFVEFYSWYENDDNVFMAMEYIPAGDLESYIGNGLTESDSRQIGRQVLYGIRDMHRLDFIHRDIKPGNVFVVQHAPHWVPFADMGALTSFCYGRSSFPLEELSRANISEIATEFLQRLLQPKPRERPASEEATAFGDSWFQLQEVATENRFQSIERAPLPDMTRLGLHDVSSLPYAEIPAGRQTGFTNQALKLPAFSGDHKANDEPKVSSATATAPATSTVSKTIIQNKTSSHANRHEESAYEHKWATDTPAGSSTEARPRKQILYFKDAVGRIFTYPWDLCRKWDSMERLIHQAFAHDDEIGPHVLNGRYDLIGPEKDIIMPVYWEDAVAPGMHITMNMWSVSKAESMPDSSLDPESLTSPMDDDFIDVGALLEGVKFPEREGVYVDQQDVALMPTQL
ncbi:hypothetical protein OHC33_000924 [Knufia fluminis]|uniref:Protein kinase domain-containing protein n=1 Tax=Knufia fluminis TaxID=191047 RepID=A0AAN8EWK4_9EURO|nr:hypothetical protein OHC33_000924 [Knufia fluminis]